MYRCCYCCCCRCCLQGRQCPQSTNLSRYRLRVVVPTFVVLGRKYPTRTSLSLLPLFSFFGCCRYRCHHPCYPSLLLLLLPSIVIITVRYSYCYRSRCYRRFRLLASSLFCTVIAVIVRFFLFVIIVHHRCSLSLSSFCIVRYFYNSYHRRSRSLLSLLSFDIIIIIAILRCHCYLSFVVDIIIAIVRYHRRYHSLLSPLSSSLSFVNLSLSLSFVAIAVYRSLPLSSLSFGVTILAVTVFYYRRYHRRYPSLSSSSSLSFIVIAFHHLSPFLSPSPFVIVIIAFILRHHCRYHYLYRSSSLSSLSFVSIAAYPSLSSPLSFVIVTIAVIVR